MECSIDPPPPSKNGGGIGGGGGYLRADGSCQVTISNLSPDSTIVEIYTIPIPIPHCRLSTNRDSVSRKTTTEVNIMWSFFYTHHDRIHFKLQ